MRGEQELACLNYVRNNIFGKNGTLIKHPFSDKTYLEATDKEFIDDEIFFINSDCYKYYFGLLEEDCFQIENILRTAKPNQQKSEFPDFVFENGFIEHFQITSSRETRKGAVHKKEMQQFKRQTAKEIEQLKQEWNEIPSFDKMRSEHWTFTNPEHNYCYLEKSLKNIWNHHIESLKKYSGNQEIGVFLIEYNEIALSMLENIFTGWIDGMSQGDLREQQKFTCYRLSRDKNLLNFIYQFMDIITYVIFVYKEGLEIIKTENIPYLLQLLPWDFIVYPMRVKGTYSVYNISLPFAPPESKNEDINQD